MQPAFSTTQYQVTICSVLSDEVYSPGSGCEDCPEEANQCINDRLCCELYSCACNAHACLLPHCVSVHCYWSIFV